MSAMSSLLRRESCGTTFTSIGRSRSAKRAAARTASASPSNGNSQASPCESQVVSPNHAETPASARRTRSISFPPSDFASAAMSDRTWRMELSLDAIGSARAVLIAGPTASGKSAAALALAEDVARSGRAAWIVNADAMQVYDGLRILTARPSAADEMAHPASALRTCVPGDPLFGRRLARRHGARASTRPKPPARCLSSSAAPASISRR